MYCQSCWRKWNNGEGFDGLLKEGWKITDDDDDDEEETDPYKAAFDKFDTDGSGQIDALELQELMKDLGITKTDFEIEQMVKEVDEDGNGEISFSEFQVMLADIMKEDGAITPPNYKAAFDKFDTDGSGQIDALEFYTKR